MESWFSLMRRSRLPFLGLRFFWPAHLASAAGMAVGTATIVGALIVGDSVRGSLRDLTLERLGGIDYAMTAPRFFHEGLAEAIAGDAAFKESFDSATPIVLLTGSARNARRSGAARDVNIIGLNEEFWRYFAGAPPDGAPTGLPAIASATAGDSPDALINRRLAEEIRLDAAGGDILISFERPSDIPAEAIYGDRTETTISIRSTVAGIADNRGVGRFSLAPNQHLPLNVYVSMERLQRRIDRRGQVNALLVGSGSEVDANSVDRSIALQGLLARHVEPRDLGLRVEVNAERGYLSVESLQMLLPDAEIVAVEAAAAQIGAQSQRTFAYLANSMNAAQTPLAEIPYSMIAAMDVSAPAPFGPLTLIDGSPAPALEMGEILINAWAAERLGARVGTALDLTYYVDGPRGQLETRRVEGLSIRGVVALEGAGRDPGLTPEYPGVHDATNMSEWDPPFPVDLSRIGEEDEAYWDEYKTTPKAFVSLEQGMNLWASRFGRLTSIRVAPAEGKSLDETRAELERAIASRLAPPTVGLVFRPVKQEGLAAGAGSSDFGQLFLGFSLFIIISAVLLVRLFFALGVERRAREIGLLMAVGFTGSRVRRLFFVEGIALAILGATAGVGLGVLYAETMLHGLRTWWVGSVGTTFLSIHASPGSLAIGAAAGFAAGTLSVALAVASVTRADPVRLLAGARSLEGGLAPAAVASRRARERKMAAIVSTAALLALAISPMASAGGRAGFFYMGGAGLLIAAMFALSAAWRPARGRRSRLVGRGAVARLGARNAARHRARSLSTVGLVASAVFIIVAVGSMRHEGGEFELDRNSGNGGFALLAESAAPIHDDFNAPEGREALNLPGDEATERLFAETRVHPFRLLPGEDASCLNLYRPSRPRILGADEAFIDRGGFAFESSLAETDAEKENPWLLLRKGPDADGAYPAIGDATTLRWILKTGLGRIVSFNDDRGREIKLRIVGMLSKSALQKELIIAETNFIDEGLFPGHGGRNFFLIESTMEGAPALERTLEASLLDYGLDVQATQRRLEEFQAVENTYLSTFLALGGLGLLLGTLGLGAAMLRNVLERRGELALLEAVGFRTRALATLVMAENAALLLLGLAVGAGSALISVAPTLIESGSAMPWATLALTLVAVLAAGLLSGSLAVLAAARSPILESLRSG
jgi:ABC-type lipoprotein release transport system permease subunit